MLPNAGSGSRRSRNGWKEIPAGNGSVDVRRTGQRHAGPLPKHSARPEDEAETEVVASCNDFTQPVFDGSQPS